MSTLPLAGVTVVALEHAIAAPFCTRQLADFGARVIKVERLAGGDFARSYDQRVRGLSSHFVWTNRSKESLAIDLKVPGARAVLARLLAGADVFVQNLAPGAAARMGLDYGSLSAAHPRLVVCDISGYGDDPQAPGPYRNRRAYDLLIQAECGFLSVTGTPSEMAKAGCSIADIAAGMYAFSNILLALLERSRTGRGKRIDVSMLECMAEWMSYPLYYGFEGAAPPARTGATHATIYPYGVFPAGDGLPVFLAVQNEAEWARFCDQLLRRPELARDERFETNSKRSANRAELQPLIVEALSALPARQAIDLLVQINIAVASINDVAGLWRHPQLEARRRWMSVQTPAGAIPALTPPGAVAGGDCRMDAVPARGEHTTSLLAELGYSAGEVARLREQKAI